MKKFLERYKNKNISFYLGLAANLILIITSIVYIAVAIGDHTYSDITFSLILCGGILSIIYYLLNIKILDFMLVISSILYGFGFGQQIVLTLESLSDVWNNVNFIGGNAYMGLTFSIIFLIFIILHVVVTFINEEKKDKIVEEVLVK